MRKTLLFALILSGTTVFSQLNITRTDFGFESNKQWNNIVKNSATGIDVTAGTAKTWDFSNIVGDGVDTVRVTSNNGTSIIVNSTARGNNTYRIVDTTYAYEVLVGIVADDPTSASLGLPHYYGKSWSGTASAGGGFVTINFSGQVLAEGSISTQLGTFDCLLVKEETSGPVNETNYYWETKEYGRIAALLNNGDLYVTTSDAAQGSGESYGEGWSIVKDDLYWSVGNHLTTKVYDIQANQLSTGGGDNQFWDFTQVSASSYLDTGLVLSDDGAVIKMDASSKVEQWFGHSDTTYNYVKIEGWELDKPYNTTMGLPHRYGKTWTSSGTTNNGAFQAIIKGNVIARGQIKTALGTFDCLLVKEDWAMATPATNYYWETKEHGRVAAHFSAYDELFVVEARHQFSSVSASVTVSSDNLAWDNGTQVNTSVYNVAQGALDVSGGTGQSWDLTAYGTGTNESGTVSATSRLHIDLPLTNNLFHKLYEENGVYFYQEIEGLKIDTPNTVTLALPYSYGKSWFSGGISKDAASMDQNFLLSGEVVGEGQITLSFGTYEGVLVKETFSGAFDKTNYFWYTQEHGRVAAYLGDSDQLIVLREAPAANSTTQVSSNSFTVYPNPTSGIVSITGYQGGLVQVFDAIGTLVASAQQAQVNTSALGAGVYQLRYKGESVAVIKQ